MKLFGHFIKGIAATAAAFALLVGTPAKAGIIGVVQGPDSSFNIEVDFLNSILVDPSSNVLSLQLNGATALAGPIVWDGYSSLSGSSATPSVSGLDTSLLTFSWGQFGFLPTQTFFINGLDPDFAGSPSSGLTVSDLIGVSVSVNHRNGTNFVGSFVDNPIPGTGLILQPGLVSVVPEPGTLALLGLGLAGLGLARRRRVAA